MKDQECKRTEHDPAIDADGDTVCLKCNIVLREGVHARLFQTDRLDMQFIGKANIRRQ